MIPHRAFRRITHYVSEIFNGGNGPGNINLNMKSIITSLMPFHQSREGNHKFNTINQRTIIALNKR